MSLFRRRRQNPDSPDILSTISKLLAEFRASPSTDQISNRILDTSAQFVSADGLALLIHSTDQREAVLLQGRGRWKQLAGSRLPVRQQSGMQTVDPTDYPILQKSFARQDAVAPSITLFPLKARGRVAGSLAVACNPKESRQLSPREVHALSAVADIAAGAILQAGLCERVDALQNQILSLRTVGRVISSSLNLHVTLNVFLDLVTTQLKADAASVLVVDPPTGVLSIASQRGFREGVADQNRLRRNHSLASAACLERRILSLRGYGRDDPALANQPLMQAEGFLSYVASPLLVHGQVKGVLEVFRRSATALDTEWAEQLESLAQQCAIAISNAEAVEKLQRVQSELTLACDSTIEGWSRAVDLRAQEAEGHSLRVSEWAVRMAERMGVPPEQWVSIRRGALLHDIGKIGVPDCILLKPGSLSEEEWRLMRKHPQFAEELLSPIEFLRPAMDIPRYHHERWDGQGYPYGLSGEVIPLAARLFTVVDVWDSLLAQRPFRKAWTEAETMQYLRQESGSVFDPRAVDIFLSMV